MTVRKLEIDHNTAIRVLQKRGAVERLLYLNTVRTAPRLAQDPDYRKKFIGYYRMGRKKMSFYSAYFLLLEEAAIASDQTLQQILQRLFQATGERHLSFSSKLLATVDDRVAIFDRNVAHILAVKNGPLPKSGWVGKALERYTAVESGVAAFIKQADWPETEATFDTAFPNAKELSANRKADLLLWASY